MSEGTSVDFDRIFPFLGGHLGRWQLKTYFICSLVSVANGIFMMSWTFTAFQMENRCYIPQCESLETATFYKNLTDKSFYDYVDQTGVNKCQYLSPKQEEMSCQEYEELLQSKDLRAQEFEVRTCPFDSLIFDTSVVQSSLSVDYGLVCDKLPVRSLLGTTFMVGNLFGSFFLGLFSDRFGRSKAIFVSLVVASVSGVLSVLAKDAWGLGILRFLTGFGLIGKYMAAFVLVVEMLEPEEVYLVQLLNVPFVIGELIFGLEAYLIRDWVQLQLLAFAPVILLVFAYFFLDESPRWLLAMGYWKEGDKVLRKIAKTNDIDFQDALKKSQTGDRAMTAEPDASKISLWKVFKVKPLALRLLNMSFQWFSCSLSYFGLSYASTSMSGDSYTNYILIVLIELPGYLCCLFAMKYWGRRPFLIFGQITSGLACILAGFLFKYPDLSILQLCLSMIGKFGATASFGLVYSYTAELFPTAVRNNSIGFCSTIARFGSFLSLMVQFLNIYWDALPMVIFGGSGIAAGLLAFFFPETLGKRLPDTIGQALEIDS